MPYTPRHAAVKTRRRHRKPDLTPLFALCMACLAVIAFILAAVIPPHVTAMEPEPEEIETIEPVTAMAHAVVTDTARPRILAVSHGIGPVLQPDPAAESIDTPVDEPVNDAPDEAIDIQPDSFVPSELVPLSDNLQRVLSESSAEHDIEYPVALGLVQLESSFDINALNPDTLCYGLCQINPEYWPDNLDAAGNIRQGMYILDTYIIKYDHDIRAALTGYNAGYDTGDRVFAETVLSYAAAWAEALDIPWTMP